MKEKSWWVKYNMPTLKKETVFKQNIGMVHFTKIFFNDWKELIQNILRFLFLDTFNLYLNNKNADYILGVVVVCAVS